MTQRERHLEALQRVREQVEPDPHVVALLLSGSLSYGTVWERSDIDLELIVRDGAGPEAGQPDYCLEENGIEIHLALCTVSEFKRTMRRLRGGESTHSYFGHGTMVFSKDPSLLEFFEETRTVGMDDAVLSFIDISEFLIVSMIRAEKWITVFKDPLYAQRFLVHCCLHAADMVLLLHREDPNRESVLRAIELDPAFMRPLYERSLTERLTIDEVAALLQSCDDFLMRHVDWWSQPIVEYLSDGEPRRVSQLIRHFNVRNMFYPLSYLAEKGVILRLTQPARVFKRSPLTLEEVAYTTMTEGMH